MNSDEFQREQREVLLSLDVERMKAFLRRWSGDPELVARLDEMQELSLVAGMHKARAALPSFPVNERAASVVWLREHDLSVKSIGDLYDIFQERKEGGR